MRKDLGIQQAVCPMPVLLIATYDENGKVDVMNAAWGNICDPDKIALCLSSNHKTVKNLLKTGAFTVSPAPADRLKEADYFGMASGNSVADKFERTGLSAKRSAFVNAPIIDEFPVTMECELLEEVSIPNLHVFIGKIINVSADERVLDENGKVVINKCGFIAFDSFRAGYYALGERLGQAWDSGKALL